jgi:hypothetical protein
MEKSKAFKKSADTLRRGMWWQNKKWQAIGIGIAMLILAILILVVVMQFT